MAIVTLLEEKLSENWVRAKMPVTQLRISLDPTCVPFSGI